MLSALVTFHISDIHILVIKSGQSTSQQAGPLWGLLMYMDTINRHNQSIILGASCASLAKAAPLHYILIQHAERAVQDREMPANYRRGGVDDSSPSRGPLLLLTLPQKCTRAYRNLRPTASGHPKGIRKQPGGDQHD